jgi:hypothetical protein
VISVQTSVISVVKLFPPRHSPEHPFFKFPEKLELPENKTVHQQDHIINRKDADPIRDLCPGGNPLGKGYMEKWFFQ